MLAMKHLFIVFLIIFSAFAVKSQNWKLIDSGVGLIVSDENYDKQLRIIERNTLFDLKELTETGAMNGKYRGNQLFASWLQGPPASSYANSYGTPVWMYKYKITYPDGKTYEAGPYGFYQSGFTYFGINTGNYTEGNWKIEWFIVHRETQETRLVATNEFKTKSGNPVPAAASGWQVKDIGIGIYDQSEYDRVLKIVKRGDNWSQKQLYADGFFSNRDKIFGTWMEGPPVSTFVNQYGTPVWLAKFDIRYPDGSHKEFGPYGFYQTGFITMFISVGENQTGKWKIDYYIVHRETQQTQKIDSREFTITP